MAEKVWRGDAVPRAQVTTVTPVGFTTGDAVTLLINGKTLQVTAASNEDADLVLAIADAWNESTIPEFAEITASVSDDGTHVILTADEAGRPFTVAGSTGSAATIEIQTTVAGRESRNETQKLELLGTVTGGSFTVTFDGQTTGAIAYNATAAAVKSTLEALSNIAPDDVSVTGSGPWFVTFGGAYTETDVPLMTVDGTSLIGSGEVTVTTAVQGGGASNEVQIISLFNVTSGTYRLSFSGSTTGDIAWDANAATVKAALEALPSIGAGNVDVLGGPRDARHYSFVVAFIGALRGQDLPNMTIDISTLGADSGSVSTNYGGNSTTDELQHVYLGGANSGTWRLSYDGETTVDIDAHELTPSVVKNALEGLSSIGSGNIFIQWTSYGLWGIRFVGALAGTNVSTLVLNSSLLTGMLDTPGVMVSSDGGGFRDEVQHVVIGGTGGSFSLSFDGQTTGAIAYGAMAADVETALEALSNIDDVTVTGSGTPADPYVVTFGGTLGDTDVPEMTGDGSSLTGGGGQATTVTTAQTGVDEVQTVTLEVGVIGGTFTLTVAGYGTTAAIAYNAAASAVQSALEAVVGSGNVLVSGSAGGPYTVTFQGALGDRDMPLLTYDSSQLISGSGSESLAITTTITSAGPNHWDDPANWTGGAIPVTGDDVFIASGTSDILFGLQQSAVTLASLTVHSRYSGRIGLPERTETGYWEYRPTYLAIGASVISIGNGEGTGSGRIKLDTGAVQTAITVLNTGGSIEPGLPALQWKGSHAGNTLLALSGDVGVAVLATETALLDLTQRSGSVELGGGVSLGRLDKTGGELRADDAVLSGALIIRG